LNIFSIEKLAQVKSDINIISWSRKIISQGDQYLVDAGMNKSQIEGLSSIANKTKMSDINIQDLSVITKIPATLRDEFFTSIRDHALSFIKGKTKEEFAPSSPMGVSLRPVQKPSESNVPSIPEKEKKKTIPLVKTIVNDKKKTKGFSLFEFLDKSDDKNWKSLSISVPSQELNAELSKILYHLRIIFDRKSSDNGFTNIVPSITAESYNELIDTLKNNEWDISKADPQAQNHLITEEKRKAEAGYVEFVARNVMEETNGNWMYEIKVPNLHKKDLSRQQEVVECITFSFIGITDDQKYTKEIKDELGNEVPRKRLCKIYGGDDIEATRKGWYVRGDPSDFQRFADICNSRKIDVSSLSSMAIDDFYANKFYDPRKGRMVDPRLSRFEGLIDGDGYNSESDFIKAAEIAAKEGLASKERLRNPAADVSGLKAYPMQLDGIKFLYSRTHAILGDETGVGKTMQAVVAGHLRLNTDSNKAGKDMKAVVLTKSAVVPQYKRDIALFTGINERDIWTGDELFEHLIQYDHPTRILDQNGNPRIPVPAWKWCILNYEKFAIPPRTNVIRNIINRKQEILAAYSVIMSKAQQYAESMADQLYQIATSAAGNLRYGTNEYIKQVGMALSSHGQASLGSTPSLYLNQKDSSWFNEKMSLEIERLAQATAYDVIRSVFTTRRKTKSVEDMKIKVRIALKEAIQSKNNMINLFIQRQQLRLQRTGELNDVLYRLEDPNLSQDERTELENERRLLEMIKGRSDGGVNWGEEGKRNILTAYFSALSKMGILNTVILDEVHTVKNGDPDDRAANFDDEHNANFTTFNTQIVTRGADNVWGASATIVANTEQDLYNQLRAVNSPLGDLDYKSFVAQMSSALGGDKNVSTGTAIRDALIQSKIYIQRSKHNIIAQDPTRSPLPPQHDHEKMISDEDAIASFTRMKNTEVTNAMNRGKLNPLTMYGIDRMSLAEAKAPKTVQFAMSILEKGQRVGIFTDSLKAGDEIQRGITKALSNLPSSSLLANKRVYFLNGRESPDQRMSEVDQFMKSPDQSPYAAMVISFKAGGTGLSMENTANYIIFNDLPQTPVLDTQAKGRFYRINSKEESNVFYMILNAEEDEELYDILLRKIRIANEIQRLTIEDIEAVMQGNVRSDFRMQRLAAIAALESAMRSLEQEEKTKNKLSLRNATDIAKRSQHSSWYKLAHMSEIYF
jgi:hypothetical protein